MRLSRSRGRDPGSTESRGAGARGTHLSAGKGAPGHGERAVQLGRVIVLQRRVQLIPGGSRGSSCSRGARGRGRGRSGGSYFRIGSPAGGVRGGRRLVFLLQLPESAEGHGSCAPATRHSLRSAALAALGDASRAGRVSPPFIGSGVAWGEADGCLAPGAQAPPPGNRCPGAPPTARTACLAGETWGPGCPM